ncbi:MAG: aminotransferase class I/II-fold pyridoxal phosphate-dependent enzyme [Alphaproteobacteria bacterium]|nr:aminotransferase class I/II-fold pyridoxal phosphate-dependent enzyme [Alphaproteobacteria bacterium]
MEIKYSDKISGASKYAFAEIDKKVIQLKEQGVKVIDFGVGDPTTPTPNFITSKMKKLVKKHNTSGYPSYIGSKDYREACAKYMKKEFSIELNPETEICSTIGSKEAVFHFPLGFINPRDLVICPTPGYPPYRTGTQFAGGIVYNTPLLEENNFLIDYEKIPADIAEKAKIIWINYPNSPTGVSAPDEWTKGLIEWAAKNNIIIASDEGCYIDIFFKEKQNSILKFKKEGIITFYSLSKRNNMTGYRVGFVAGDEKIISGFKKVKTNIDSGTPDFVQEAAIIALQDNKHAEIMRKEYEEKRNLIIEALSSKGLEAPKGDATFYLWQKAPNGMTGIELAEKLIEIGIVVTPGSAISSKTVDDIDPGERFVRFALVPKMEEVKEAVRRIKSNLEI